MGLVVEWLRNRKLVELLFISEATVRHHLTSTFNKLEVSDRLELIDFANRNGMAKQPA